MIAAAPLIDTRQVPGAREGWCWSPHCHGRAMYPPETAQGIYQIRCDHWEPHTATIHNYDHHTSTRQEPS